MHLKGKQIKDYVVGEPIATQQNGQLFQARHIKGRPLSILMLEKQHIDHNTFVAYNNLIQENTRKIHPEYVEPIQSNHNIYIVL